MLFIVASLNSLLKDVQLSSVTCQIPDIFDSTTVIQKILQLSLILYSFIESSLNFTDFPESIKERSYFWKMLVCNMAII